MPGVDDVSITGPDTPGALKTTDHRVYDPGITDNIIIYSLEGQFPYPNAAGTSYVQPKGAAIGIAQCYRLGYAESATMGANGGSHHQSKDNQPTTKVMQ